MFFICFFIYFLKKDEQNMEKQKTEIKKTRTKIETTQQQIFLKTKNFGVSISTCVNIRRNTKS